MNMLTKADKENLLRAIMHMEDKCEGVMTMGEYASTVRLCQDVGAPQFITEYFARKFVTGFQSPKTEEV